MREESAGAIGFVDILVGAMAAVVLLFMAQAKPPPRPGFGVGGPSLRVWIDEGQTPAPLPGLAVRFRVRGRPEAQSPEGLSRAGETRLFSMREPDGSPSHLIRFSATARFEEGESLLVHVHDLNGRPRHGPGGAPRPPDIAVKYEYQGRGTDSRTGILLLSAESPVRLVPLRHLSGQRGQGGRIEWKEP
jgi:hypothetical protein